jgi:hypothetical protein
MMKEFRANAPGGGLMEIKAKQATDLAACGMG